MAALELWLARTTLARCTMALGKRQLAPARAKALYTLSGLATPFQGGGILMLLELPGQIGHC